MNKKSLLHSQQSHSIQPLANHFNKQTSRIVNRHTKSSSSYIVDKEVDYKKILIEMVSSIFNIKESAGKRVITAHNYFFGKNKLDYILLSYATPENPSKKIESAIGIRSFDVLSDAFHSLPQSDKESEYEFPLIIFDKKKFLNKETEAQKKWEAHWSRYYRKNENLRYKEDGKMLMMPFLLNDAKQPHTVGMMWGINKKNKDFIKRSKGLLDYYLNIDSVSESLGIPLYEDYDNQSDWQKSILKKLLPDTPFEENSTPNELEYFADNLRTMEPSKCDIDKSIKIAIRESMLALGILNSKSITHIPVHLSSESIDTMMVVTIGTPKPMTVNLLDQWSLLVQQLVAPFALSLYGKNTRAQTYQELGERASSILSYVAHEAKSQFTRFFANTRSKLEKLAASPDQYNTAEIKETTLKVLHAWDSIRSTVFVSHLFARSGNTSKFETLYYETLRLPLIQLLQKDDDGFLLKQALHFVAHQTYQLESNRSPTTKQPLYVIKGLKNVTEQDITLKESQFTNCYILVAEMIRNYGRHGNTDDSPATWNIKYKKNNGLCFMLEQDHKSSALPDSQSFQILEEFIRLSKTGSKAELYWKNKERGRIVWKVHLSHEFFEERIEETIA